MEIIVEGHKFDTKDIWKIEECEDRGYDGMVIGLIDRPDLVWKEYTDNLYSYNRSCVRSKYQRLIKSLKEKWEQDKNDLTIFKL